MWNPNAITFANSSTVGSNPYSMFVDIDDTVYVAARSLNYVQVWLAGSTSPIRNIASGLINPIAVFVTINGDIYIDNGLNHSQVDKWKLSATSGAAAASIIDVCYGLHIDLYGALYCSINAVHQVIKHVLLNGTSNSSIIVAGNGTNGTLPFMLSMPRGIFVDRLLNLFVADCGNDRIQFFRAGKVNGTTAAGVSASGTITLKCPTAVTLDGNDYLFILDRDNHRLVGQGSSGFRCVVGCTGTSGSTSNKLLSPRSFSFDSYGNIFVVDTSNNRIQKFLFMSESCGE